MDIRGGAHHEQYVPVLVVAGAEPPQANGEYIPTQYEELGDGYLGSFFAPASGRPTWQRSVSDDEFYIIGYCSKKLAPKVLFNAWKIYKCDGGGGSVLYTRPPVIGRYLPPEADWRHNSEEHDPCLSPLAPSLSVTELAPVLVRIQMAAAPTEGKAEAEAGSSSFRLECIGMLSGENIATLCCGKADLVQDVKTKLALQLRSSVVIFAASGVRAATWEEELMPVREFVEEKPADEYAQRHIFLENLRQGDSSFCSLPADQQADREVLLASLEYDGLSLQLASAELRSDREVVLMAVRSSALSLEFASEGLRGDREVVLMALDNDGLSLEFASGHLRRDPSIVKKAMEDDPDAFKYALGEAKSNPELILLAKLDSMAVDELNSELEKRGLPQTGGRAALRTRLKEAIAVATNSA